MATLRELQKQQTRQLLLAKGLEMFEAKGYAATTIDDIAGAVGTTRTTFYLHFPSKAELVRELIAQVDDILTQDDPPLSKVVELGRRDMVRAWLDHKFDQWETIRPYVQTAHQAAAAEPEVADKIEAWFQDTAAWMQEGLDAADRFAPESRRIRCTLAFGELEFLSLRWFRQGWTVDREVCLEILTDSWCHLLIEE